ncbi:MAG TPA: TRAP transporter small permease subunit [Acidiferrobacterales bacterium]|jgi:TRAP-type mannitol/chloroaromatic compound transport system permease small subunit
MSPWLSRLTRLGRALEAVSEWSGRAVSWLALALVLLVSYDVGMRYLFNRGSVGLQELEWHLFALLFLLGAAYALRHDAHVRVDVLHHRMSREQRALVDLIGGLIVLLPVCALIVYSSWPFVHNAFVYGEGSPDPGGLPHRFLLKAAIPAGFLLLALQGVADIIRNLAVVLGADRGVRR